MPSDTRLCGAVGFFLDAAFLLVVTWRLAAHLRASPWNRWGVRKVFHLLLWTAIALGLPLDAYRWWSESEPKGAYALHLLALSCGLLAFSTVLLLWTTTLRIVTRKRSVDERVVYVVNGIYFCYTLVVVAGVLTTEERLDDWVKHNAEYRALLLITCFTSLLYALSVLALGSRLYYKLVHHPAWEPLATQQQKRVLGRLNVVMSASFLCFSLRALMVCLGIYYDNGMVSDMSLTAFYTLSTWIPEYVPFTVLLFVMRKPDKLAEPLGASPPAPGRVGPGSVGSSARYSELSDSPGV